MDISTSQTREPFVFLVVLVVCKHLTEPPQSQVLSKEGACPFQPRMAPQHLPIVTPASWVLTTWMVVVSTRQMSLAADDAAFNRVLAVKHPLLIFLLCIMPFFSCVAVHGIKVGAGARHRHCRRHRRRHWSCEHRGLFSFVHFEPNQSITLQRIRVFIWRHFLSM